MIVETLPMLSDNYGYLVVCAETRQAAVVDPAEAEPVISHCETHRLQLVAIWNTHHHADHTAGNRDLIARYAPEVVAHKSDARRIFGVTHPVAHGDSVTVGRLSARVVHTPGHTRGSIAYLCGDAVFAGDTLFCCGCGRLYEGTAAELYASLNSSIASLPRETRVFVGHEYTEKNVAFAMSIDGVNKALAHRAEHVCALRRRGSPSVPSTIADELATNPFLRCGNETLRAQLSVRFPKHAIERPVDAFTLLRQLRDRF